MKPIICIAPAPAVEPMFFSDGWMVNKKYFLGVTAGGGVPVMATDIELVEEYARLCDGLVLTGSAMFTPSPAYAAQAQVIENQTGSFGPGIILRVSAGREAGSWYLPRPAEHQRVSGRYPGEKIQTHRRRGAFDA